MDNPQVKEEIRLPSIMQPSDTFSTKYEFADAFTDQQESVNWRARDYNMADDMQDFRTKLTKPERMLIIETQKLFSHYEMALGLEFWTGKFTRLFPRVEFQRMGTMFGMIETTVHLKFYTQMMDALAMNTAEFFNAPYEDEVLTQSLQYVVEAIKCDDPLKCLAAFCFLEGTVLFSSLAALMSFRAPGGINAMANMVSGISHSCQDEVLHCGAAAAIFQELLKESNLSNQELEELEAHIRQLSKSVVDHERRVISKLFSYGDIRFLGKEDLVRFVEHRADECTKLLGYEVEEDNRPNPISEWFYLSFQGYGVHDFFNVSGKNYELFVDKNRFTW